MLVSVHATKTEVVIAAVEAARHPSAGYLTSCMRGESTPDWSVSPKR